MKTAAWSVPQGRLLRPYTGVLLEDRFVVHITETVIGTGLMDFDTILKLVHEVKPDAYVVIEHLPINIIPLAKRNLTQKIRIWGCR